MNLDGNYVGQRFNSKKNKTDEDMEKRDVALVRTSYIIVHIKVHELRGLLNVQTSNQIRSILTTPTQR